jgi:TolC family type I secretion outer membrane protein
MPMSPMSRMTCASLTLMMIPFAADVARAEVFTLQEALSVAYETNPRLEAERAQLRATDEEVAKALSNWRPNVGVSGTYGWTSNEFNTAILPVPDGHPRDVTVTLTQPIFTGQTIPLTRQANAQVRAGRFQLTSVEQQVLLAAAQAYFNVVADEAVLKFRRDNVMLLSGQLSMTQERVNIGDITITDLQLVQARLAAANAEVQTAEARLASSRAEFLRAIGRPAESLDVMPPLPNMAEGQMQATTLALENNPDLNTAREQARVADAAVDVATGALLPSLSVQGQYAKSRDQAGLGVELESTSVIAQVRVPIYQGGAEYAGVRQAKQNRSKATFTIGDIERQVRQNVDAAWQATISARAATTLYEQQVQAAQLAYEGFAEGVRAGERSTYDMLNSAQELLSARVSLAFARREYWSNSYQLTVAEGGLTAQALSLPVTLYNPQLYYDRNAGRWFGLTGR